VAAEACWREENIEEYVRPRSRAVRRDYLLRVRREPMKNGYRGDLVVSPRMSEMANRGSNAGEEAT